MSAACPFCVTWISLSLSSICPDPRNREDHKLLLRPNSCLNPSVSSAAEEVPESDPNHHPSISVISVCLTSAVCWFKSDQFYEKKLLERPTSSFAIESTSWANQQRWWSLHWEFENPPCNFNVAKTNAILRISLFTMNSRIKETNTVLRFEKGPSLEKRKKHEWLSWKSVISSASQSSQIHNITAPPEEMLFRCLERRLNLNLMLGPGLPQKASTFETTHFHQPLSCGQRCVDVNNIIKICWEGNQQLLKGCKNHFHGYWKHVRNMSFFCLSVSLKRSWLTRRVYVCVSSLDAERLPSSACQRSSCETKFVTWRQWTQAMSSDCRPETSCCASFPCSLWTIEIKH